MQHIRLEGLALALAARWSHVLWFLGVVAGAALFIVVALGFAADSLARSVAPASVKATGRSYVTSSLPQLAAADFDISRIVEVRPGGTPVPPVGETASVIDAVAHPESGIVVTGATHAVAVPALRVRVGPSKIAAEAFILPSRTQVRLVSRQLGWAEVEAPGGRRGWVYERLLAPLPSSLVSTR